MIVIAVHGTGDNSSTVDVPRWWQRNSEFFKQYIDRLAQGGQTVEVSSFQWSGANSERDRRRAGIKLAAELSKYEREGVEYHLLGHSHGGSVMEAALVYLIVSRRRALPNLRSITTIGTPFLIARPKRVSLQKFADVLIHPWWWIPAVLGLCALAVHLVRRDDNYVASLDLWAMMFLGVRTSATLQVASLVFGLVILITIPRVIASVLIGRGMLSHRQSQCLSSATEAIRQHLWHPGDEAICALQGASKARLSLFSQVRLSALLAAPISPLLLIGTLLLFAAAAVSSSALYPLLMLDGGELLRDPGAAIAEALRTLILMSQTWFVRAVGISDANVNENASAETVIWLSYMTRLCIIPALLFAAASMLGRLFNRPYQKTVGRMLDRVVAGRVRGSAFGADVGWIGLHGASHKPTYIMRDHPPLPDNVREEMTAAVEQGAIETLRKLRANLGSALYTTADFDLLATMSSHITWRELIHTTYFATPSFIEHLVSGTLKIAGMTASDFKGHEQRSWLEVDER